ncbi:hypothetical protein M885DRAFT_515071 [Pelagophyceae sp. CCMP2097]|nr:hypothetical protein M885DRAFT_515071 [Pelagophyceae sp. CCMP2097]
MAAPLSAVKEALRRTSPFRAITLETLTTTVADRRTAPKFMHEVLPPLLANLALEFDSAPPRLRQSPFIESIRAWYDESAVTIERARAPPEWGAWRQTPSASFQAAEAEFGDALESIRAAGGSMKRKIFCAVETNTTDIGDEASEVDVWMTRFFSKRLTLRLLLGQYAACRAHEAGKPAAFYLRSTFAGLDTNNDGVLDADELARAQTLYSDADVPHESKPSVCGLVDTHTSPFDIAVQAIADVQEECRCSAARQSPPFSLHGRGQNLTMPYLPRHLYKILRDVLRHAARATLLRANGGLPKPIRVVISDGIEQGDVVIKVADEGGGMPRSATKKVFSFAKHDASEGDLASVLADTQICYSLAKQGSLDSMPDIMRPTTHELPIARVYANFFDGDLQIRSMEGYGTDAYISIKRVATNVLPT